MGPSTNLWPFVREYHILYHIGAISKPFFYIEYIYIIHIIYIYVYISELSHMIIIEDKIPKSIQVPEKMAGNTATGHPHGAPGPGPS
jgi:hypothetical protein